jgi:hypothetical protein
MRGEDDVQLRDDVFIRSVTRAIASLRARLAAWTR